MACWTRLSILSGNDSYRERADAIIRAFGGEVRRNFFPLSTLINNAELAQKPTQIVLVGAADAPELTELRRAVHTVSLPRGIVQVVAPGEALPAGHPAAGKGLVNGKAAAYVCEGPVCSLPVSEPAALARLLAAIK